MTAPAKPDRRFLYDSTAILAQAAESDWRSPHESRLHTRESHPLPASVRTTGPVVGVPGEP